MAGQAAFWLAFAAFAWPVIAWHRLDRALRRAERANTPRTRRHW